MPNMWEGETPALKASYADPVAVRMHRRAGEQHIAYDLDRAGCTARVYRVEKRGADWFRIDLGTVQGADPYNTFINVALEYTSHDAELFSLIATVIERRTDEVTAALRAGVKTLDGLIAEISDSIAWLTYRHGSAEPLV